MRVLESGRSALAIHTDRRVWKFSSLPKGEEAEAGNAPLTALILNPKQTLHGKIRWQGPIHVLPSRPRPTPFPRGIRCRRALSKSACYTRPREHGRTLEQRTSAIQKYSARTCVQPTLLLLLKWALAALVQRQVAHRRARLKPSRRIGNPVVKNM